MSILSLIKLLELQPQSCPAVVQQYMGKILQSTIDLFESFPDALAELQRMKKLFDGDGSTDDSGEDDNGESSDVEEEGDSG